jgi:hypothetical protein
VITVDGKLDEAVWGRAATTVPSLTLALAQANPGIPVQDGRAWDDAALYTSASGPRSESARQLQLERPSSVGERHCRIMLDPDGDPGTTEDYYEIRSTRRTWSSTPNYEQLQCPQRSRRMAFGHGVERQPPEARSCFTRTLDDDSDTDRGYTVEAKIPGPRSPKAL